MADELCKSTDSTGARKGVAQCRNVWLIAISARRDRPRQPMLQLSLKAVLDECDRQILSQLRAFDAKNAEGSFGGDKPPASLDEAMMRMSGVDLTDIDGIDTASAVKIIAEIGIDMSRWKTDKHFTSWMALAPGAKISGGKVLSSATKKIANRAAQAFRMAAYGLARSKSALGAYFRRQKARLGAPKAITATARKLATIVYAMLKNGTCYNDLGQDYYEERYQSRVIQNLKRKAKHLGFELTPTGGELVVS